MLGIGVNGDVIASWINRTIDGVESIEVAIWRDDSWSDSKSLDVQEHVIIGPEIGTVDDRAVVAWTEESGVGDPAEPARLKVATIYENQLLADNSTSRDAFEVVAAAVDNPVCWDSRQSELYGLVDSSLVLTTQSIGGLPPGCCPCKYKDVETNQDQGCGFSTKIDKASCIRYITYNPCVPRPSDPNDIIGPRGFGDEHWVAAGDTLEYMIRFENEPSATAPAQEVVITQELDPDLDARTFRLGDFGWSGMLFEVPENRAFYSNRIDLVESHGFYVDITAYIDVQTSTANWIIRTIDPATGDVPLDAFTGFSPINDDSGIGEGFVTYTVSSSDDVQTGDVIDAQARIVFDTEEPIDTPPTFNTIDAASPASSVHSLPLMADETSFQVSWAGNDDSNGSGLAGYTVYVSDNGGPFEVWLANTDLTEAPFIGEPSHTYAFYAIARDNTGNVEEVPAEPDTITTLPGPAGITVVPVSGLTTSEDGSSATVAIVLDSIPTAPVTISVTSGDNTEGTV